VTPKEYAIEVVMPTVQEYIRHRNDRRLAYLSCIAAYHLTDYVATAEGTSKSDVCQKIRAICANAFDVVQGICHGSKHSRATTAAFKFEAGSERPVPPFAYGVGAYGHGRYGGVGGHEVDHNGHTMFVDVCLTVVLATFKREYPQHFVDVEFKFE
jgi:hypothetical protein